jgi:uncharacterized protein
MSQTQDLRFNVAGLLKAPVGETRAYSIYAPVPALDEYPLTQPLTGQVRLTRVPDGVLIQGALATEVELDCSRCLARFRLPVTVQLDEQYHPTIDITTGEPLPLPTDEMAFTIDEAHEVDLTEALRQNLLVILPMQPLCQKACKGFCPQCGQNLNQGPCACPDEPVDTRWEALREAFERLQADGRKQA